VVQSLDRHVPSIAEAVRGGTASEASAPSNKRLKLTARVDLGMNLSSARRSLSAIR
jgi:hypothetical protein